MLKALQVIWGQSITGQGHKVNMEVKSLVIQIKDIKSQGSWSGGYHLKGLAQGTFIPKTILKG